MFIIFIVEDWN